MTARTLVAVAALVAAAGCASGPSRADNHLRTVAVPTAASGTPWTLSVMVANNARFAHDITVDLDDKRAIDATFPAAPPGANNPTVTEYTFNLADGVHRLVAANTGGGRAQLSVPIRNGRQVWVVIQDYDKPLPLEANIYDHRPGFG